MAHETTVIKDDEAANLLNTTPIRVKMISCEMTKNAKYRAMTARSSRECVRAPWYCDNHRITMGKKKPNSAETAGGSTPEMNVKDPGDESDQSCRKGTKVVN